MNTNSSGQIQGKLASAQGTDQQKAALAEAKAWLLALDPLKHAGVAAQIDLAVSPPLVVAAIRSVGEYMRAIPADTIPATPGVPATPGPGVPPADLVKRLEDAKTDAEEKAALAEAKAWLLKTDATKFAGVLGQISIDLAASTPAMQTEAVHSARKYLQELISAPPTTPPTPPTNVKPPDVVSMSQRAAPVAVPPVPSTGKGNGER